MLSAWNRRGGPFKDALDDAQKYVASRSPATTLEWPNSTLLHGDVPAAAAELKQTSDANLAENLLFAFLPGAGRFAPVHAGNALIGLTTNHLLHATASGLVLIAWTAALALIGVALAARRDVN